MFIDLSRQLIINLLTLLCILILTFFLLHMVPGGPFDAERVLPPEIEQNLYDHYGLTKKGDQSFIVWFGADLMSYLSYLEKGELGPSLKYKDRDVSSIISQAMGPSLILGMLAFGVSLTLGIVLGCIATIYKKSFLGMGILGLSTLLISFPSFVMATVLVLIFSLWLQLLPPALWEGPQYLLLPLLSLAAVPMAYFIQLTHSGLESQLKADYIRVARAKGVSPKKIYFMHALKNAGIPLLTIMGPMMAALITGSFVVETIFAIPGLGRHFITAIVDRDYFLVMGITLLYSILLIGLNWIVDVGYLILDPRMRKNA